MAVHTSFRYRSIDLWAVFKEIFINKICKFPAHLNTLNKQFPKIAKAHRAAPGAM